MTLFAPFGFEGEREGYDTGEYADLRPGEVREGWVSTYIPLDWQPEDMEIHFEPVPSGTIAIWKLGEDFGASAATEETLGGEVVIPTELEAREKVEEGAVEVANLSSDRQSLRQVADWLPRGWKVGMLVVRDDNPTRWGQKPQTYYYLEVRSQGGDLFVTWGVQNFYYYKSWTEIEEAIVKNYPPGTTDWAGGFFISGEVWRDDPLWQEEELWEKDTFWESEFWDYVYGAKEEAPIPPTIKLEIDKGPLYSLEDKVCYYRIRAVVSGGVSRQFRNFILTSKIEISYPGMKN